MKVSKTSLMPFILIMKMYAIHLNYALIKSEPLVQNLLTWYRIDTTAPQISSPTMNCSPSIARTRFSQQREAKPFLSRKINFPPL
jgi:hypothetical protein